MTWSISEWQGQRRESATASHVWNPHKARMFTIFMSKVSKGYVDLFSNSQSKKCVSHEQFELETSWALKLNFVCNCPISVAPYQCFPVIHTSRLESEVIMIEMFPLLCAPKFQTYWMWLYSKAKLWFEPCKDHMEHAFLMCCSATEAFCSKVSLWWSFIARFAIPQKLQLPVYSDSICLLLQII